MVIYDWEIAVDLSDIGDEEEFVATVLHEYFHLLTLNGDQVCYTQRQTIDTYNEWGMVSKPDSYLNRYYERFWQDILDDRLVNPLGDGFYLRHRDAFVSPYAATDPSEDMCESFSCFILQDYPTGETIAQQKLQFFYEFEELVRLREEIRANLGLSEG